MYGGADNHLELMFLPESSLCSPRMRTEGPECLRPMAAHDKRTTTRRRDYACYESRSTLCAQSPSTTHRTHACTNVHTGLSIFKDPCLRAHTLLFSKISACVHVHCYFQRSLLACMYITAHTRTEREREALQAQSPLACPNRAESHTIGSNTHTHTLNVTPAHAPNPNVQAHAPLLACPAARTSPHSPHSPHLSERRFRRWQA
eukprot:352554-Chlamydomonas_euryale.AAC.1